MNENWLPTSAAPIADRAQAQSEVLRSITSGFLFGSVVVGKSGVGKSSLLHQVLRSMAPDTHVVHLRGTALSSGKRYSAIAYLLNALPPVQADDRDTVAEALTRQLREAAGTSPIIILIDNADTLDADTADVLAQLALDRTVKLLIACRDLAQCPTSLMTLWLEGALLRVDLDNMSLTEAQRLLTEELQGKVSRSAAFELWNCSAGNARLMQLLVHDFVQSGRVVLQNDVWVLCPGQVKLSQQTADATLARLGPLTQSQVTLLEVLALAGHMPMPLALSLSSVENLDHLHTVGAIELLSGQQQIVQVEALLAQVVRERIGPFRRISHFHAVTKNSGSGQLALHPIRYADWTLECGFPLDAGAGLNAMTMANDHHDPETALRIAAAIAEDVSVDLPVMLETARAHLLEEDETSALRTLGAVRAAVRELLPVADLEHLEASSDQSVSVQIEVARAVMAHATPQLLGTGWGPAGPPAGENEILLAQLEQFASEGRYEEIRSTLLSIDGGRRRADPETEIQFTGLIALANAVTDRQREALAMAKEAKASLHAVKLTPPVRARLAARIQLAFHLTGQAEGDWSAVDQYLEPATGDGAAGELRDAVRLAFLGRADEALELLVPALAQLQVHDPTGLCHLASAVAAYCYALRGDLSEMRTLLVPFDGRPEETPAGLPLYSLRFFRALTLALIGSGAGAITKLEELAKEEGAAGRYALELPVRAAILRLGGQGAAEPLLTVAARIQGPFSAMCARFGEGVLYKKPDMLLEAVALAESLGSELFVADITEVARAMAVATGDRTLARQVRRVIVNSSQVTEESDADKQLNLLTPREEEVARLARTGMGNKEMAANLHVSVRTVEGHLYQIYVKLGVSSRSDLVEALSDLEPSD